MALFLLLTIVGNTQATFAQIPASTIDDDSLNSQPVVKNITDKQLKKIIKNRVTDPNSYKGQTLYLKVNEKQVDSSSSENKAKDTAPSIAPNKAPWEVRSLKGKKYLFTRYTNTKTGQIFDLKESRDDIEKSSPTEITRRYAKMFMSSSAEAIGPQKTYPFIKFAPSALTFYSAVGFNMIMDLYLNYDKDPMALQHFIDELKSPMGWVSFYAFTGGQAYAKNIFLDIIKTYDLHVSRPDLFKIGSDGKYSQIVGRANMPLGFLAMAFGSIASSAAMDLYNLAAPCTSAILNPNGLPEGESANSDFAVTNMQRCSEAYHQIYSSDNGFRYVTSSASAVISAIGAGIITNAGTKILKTPVESVYLVADQVAVKEAYHLGTNYLGTALKGVRGFGGWAVGVSNLVVFLRLQDIVEPYIYHFVESRFNSGKKLAEATYATHYWIKDLDKNDWSDNIEGSCGKVDGICGGDQAIGILHEKYEKWRETLTSDFMASYNNWVKFVADFKVMHDVSQDFFDQLSVYVAGLNEKGSDFFNPLIDDEPFHGVLNSEAIPVKQEAYKVVSFASKAQRIVESLNYIDQVLEKMDSLKKQIQENGTAYFSGQDFVDSLQKAKTLILVYKTKPTTQNYSSLVQAIDIINSLYDKTYKFSLSQALEHVRSPMVADFPSKIQIEQDMTSENVRNVTRSGIKSIRDYIGNPKPLKKGEAFVEDFNDRIKKEKSQFLPLFDEYGGPAQTITRYAVCHKTLNEIGDVDQRDSSIYSVFDSAINGVLKGMNSLFNMKYNTDHHPALNFAKAIKFGTGVRFYIPNIVMGDTHNICLDKNIQQALIPITPRSDWVDSGSESLLQQTQNKNLRSIFPDGKIYGSLFDYMVHNLKPEVLNLNSANHSDFAKWWYANVEPKTAQAYQRFTEDYNGLLESTFKKILDGAIARSAQDKSAIIEISNAPREAYNNPSNLIQSYADELNTYLAILDRVYDVTAKSGHIEFNNNSQKMAAQMVVSKNISLFRKNIFQLKQDVEDLLNQYRLFDKVSVIFVDPNTKNARYPMENQYAKILLDLVNITNSMGFHVQNVNAGSPNFADPRAAAQAIEPSLSPQIIAARSLPFFEKNSASRASEASQLMIQIRLGSNAVGILRSSFDALNDLQNQKISQGKVELAAPLTYGISDKNTSFSQEGNTIKADLSKFTYKERLTMGYLASNQLTMLAERIYFNLSILKAASQDNSYETVAPPTSKPGKLGHSGGG